MSYIFRWTCEACGNENYMSFGYLYDPGSPKDIEAQKAIEAAHVNICRKCEHDRFDTDSEWV